MKKCSMLCQPGESGKLVSSLLLQWAGKLILVLDPFKKRKQSFISLPSTYSYLLCFCSKYILEENEVLNNKLYRQ